MPNYRLGSKFIQLHTPAAPGTSCFLALKQTMAVGLPHLFSIHHSPSHCSEFTWRHWAPMRVLLHLQGGGGLAWPKVHRGLRKGKGIMAEEEKCSQQNCTHKAGSPASEAIVSGKEGSCGNGGR